MRRVMVFLGVAVLALTSCQAGVSMWSSCTPASDGNVTGTDGTYILICQAGEWVPLMTVAEFAAEARGEQVTRAPLPTKSTAQAAATTSTTSTTVVVDPWAQYEGECWANLMQQADYNDLLFNGPVNTRDNAELYTGLTGCTVPVPPDYPTRTFTVVSAPDVATATQLCVSLGWTAAYQPNAFPLFPADGWFCHTP